MKKLITEFTTQELIEELTRKRKDIYIAQYYDVDNIKEIFDIDQDKSLDFLEYLENNNELILSDIDANLRDAYYEFNNE
jgi:3-hydroxy-3-methylglutaryl CoA synthase